MAKHHVLKAFSVPENGAMRKYGVGKPVSAEMVKSRNLVAKELVSKSEEDGE